MWGAILGDIIGARHEFMPTKQYDFQALHPDNRFTDDSILTIATSDAILRGTDFGAAYRAWGRAYPDGGYGGMFRQWLYSEATGPYNSFGNGAAMRVSPVAYSSEDEEDVLAMAEQSAAATHDHPEGIKGAQATALAVLLARQGTTQAALRQRIAQRFPSYDLQRQWAAIQSDYSFDATCQGTVPEALICFRKRRISRTRSAARSLWAAMPIPWPPLPAGLRALTSACPQLGRPTQPSGLRYRCRPSSSNFCKPTGPDKPPAFRRAGASSNRGHSS